MTTPPVIVVQLVHIQGPMKGEIQEFADPIINIGRDPSGHVHFPKDMTVVSRNHAEIVREGNRHKLTDHSTNGTFVNGKKVQEAYLKDGDVLTFAEGGPKVSFLTKVVEGQPETLNVEEPVSPPERPAVVSPAPAQQPVISSDAQPRQAIKVEAPPSPHNEAPPAVDLSIQTVKVPLVIQYGPTLRSFKQLPVAVGKNPACEFVIEHPAILDRHVQIFFSQEQYWVKDLTGKSMLSINGRAVETQAPVAPDDVLAFSPNGPNFRFLGGGRLAEIEAPEPAQPEPLPPENHKSVGPKKSAGKGLKGAKAIFDKFLKR